MAEDSPPEVVPLVLYDCLRAELEQLRRQHAEAMEALQQQREPPRAPREETAQQERKDKGVTIQNGHSVPELNGTTDPEATANGVEPHAGASVGIANGEAGASEAAPTEPEAAASQATGKDGAAAEAVDTRAAEGLDVKAVENDAESEPVAAQATGGKETLGLKGDRESVVQAGLTGPGIRNTEAIGTEAPGVRDTGVQVTGAEATAVKTTGVQATVAEVIGVKVTGVQATATEAVGVKAITVEATGGEATGAQTTGGQAAEAAESPGAQTTEANATGAQATATEATGTQGGVTEATGAQATVAEATDAEATGAEGPCAAVLHPGAAAAALQAELETRIRGLEEALRRREREAAAELEAARGRFAEAEAEAEEAARGRSRELEALRELLATATATGERARAEAAELRRALSVSEARVAELTSAQDAAREELERVRGASVPADEHEHALGALRDHVTRLQAQLAELARKHERTSAEVFQVSACAGLSSACSSAWACAFVRVFVCAHTSSALEARRGRPIHGNVDAGTRTVDFSRAGSALTLSPSLQPLTVLLRFKLLFFSVCVHTDRLLGKPVRTKPGLSDLSASAHTR